MILNLITGFPMATTYTKSQKKNIRRQKKKTEERTTLQELHKAQVQKILNQEHDQTGFCIWTIDAYPYFRRDQTPESDAERPYKYSKIDLNCNIVGHTIMLYNDYDPNYKGFWDSGRSLEYEIVETVQVEDFVLTRFPVQDDLNYIEPDVRITYRRYNRLQIENLLLQLLNKGVITYM